MIVKSTIATQAIVANKNSKLPLVMPIFLIKSYIITACFNKKKKAFDSMLVINNFINFKPLKLLCIFLYFYSIYRCSNREKQRINAFDFNDVDEIDFENITTTNRCSWNIRSKKIENNFSVVVVAKNFLITLKDIKAKIFYCWLSTLIITKDFCNRWLLTTTKDFCCWLTLITTKNFFDCCRYSTALIFFDF